jgi:hypothetical protein
VNLCTCCCRCFLWTFWQRETHKQQLDCSEALKVMEMETVAFERLNEKQLMKILKMFRNEILKFMQTLFHISDLQVNLSGTQPNPIKNVKSHKFHTCRQSFRDRTLLVSFKKTRCIPDICFESI